MKINKDLCPSCGYCKSCGRGNTVVPDWTWRPHTMPWYDGGTITLTSSGTSTWINPNTTEEVNN